MRTVSSPADSLQRRARLDRAFRLLIGGRLVGAQGGEQHAVHAPATGERLATIPAADGRDVAAAVDAARPVLRAWRRTMVSERAALLRTIAAVLREHREELATLDALDAGHPLSAMRFDVDLAVRAIETYAEWGAALAGEVPQADRHHLNYTVREPFGVVARIVPYNHPLMFGATKIALPLLAGNAVVLKAPDQAPLSCLRLGELLAEHVPAGLLSVIAGAGQVAGDAIVAHPEIRRIGFIGSDITGRAIQRRAAEVGVKTITLELGGKNPMLAFPDADASDVIAGAVTGMNLRMTAGQSCGSTSRLLVHESLADDVVAGLAEAISGIRLGDPLGAETEMGCLITDAHRQHVAGLVERGQRAGARLIVGGGQAAVPGERYFAPTVLDRVDPESEIGQTEVFGPVLAVTSWRDESELLEIANGTRFGLTASVWTKDVARAHALARELEAGYVWINTAAQHFEGLPFGGVKDSGVGREEDVEELRSYTQAKAVHMPLPTL